MAGYTNLKQVLVAATKYPIAIEARLPAGAPKISTGLLGVVAQIPAVPDFPIAVPEMPPLPELPEMPQVPGLPMVYSATVTPVNAGLNGRRALDRGTAIERTIPSPYAGVMPEVVTRRGM